MSTHLSYPKNTSMTGFRWFLVPCKKVASATEGLYSLVYHFAVVLQFLSSRNVLAIDCSLSLTAAMTVEEVAIDLIGVTW